MGQIVENFETQALALYMNSSIGSIETYTSAVNRIPMLTAEEERELGRRLHLKRIPALHFRYDKTTDKGEHMEEIFGRIKREEEY